jgi:hypothetical protein
VPTRGFVVSQERRGLVQRFPKLSLQGDRIGLQSALARWTRSRIEVNSDSLKSAGTRRRPGSSQPVRGFLATCKIRSNYTACDRSFVRERAPEFFRDGKEQRRQFLKATETKRRLLPLVVT